MHGNLAVNCRENTKYMISRSDSDEHRAVSQHLSINLAILDVFLNMCFS